MKTILLSILFLLIPKLAISQDSENDKIIYLDSTYSTSNQNNYELTRIIKDYKLNKPYYAILDYYKSGKLKTKAFSKSKDIFTYDGELTNYYENGNTKSVTYYSKGSEYSKYRQWYENGNKKTEGEYIHNEEKKPTQLKINQFWDINGVQKVVDGNGDYEESIDKAFGLEASFGSGKVKDGFKEDIWQGWISNPEIKYTERYSEGKLVSGKIVDKNNIEKKYDVLDKRPEHRDGITTFYTYIGKNYKTPSDAGNINGKIRVTFVVDIHGKIIEPRILSDLGYGTGDEAIRILKGYKGFIPGEHRGRKVKCLFSLPITIQSSGNSFPSNNNSFQRSNNPYQSNNNNSFR